MFYIGAFLGPFVFTFIYDALGWKPSTNIFGFVTFLYFITYTVLIYKLGSAKKWDILIEQVDECSTTL